MEESISEVTRHTTKAMANEKTLKRELNRNRAQTDVWRKRAVAAVESGDNEFAKKALIRKNGHLKLVAVELAELKKRKKAWHSLHGRPRSLAGRVTRALGSRTGERQSGDDSLAF